MTNRSVAGRWNSFFVTTQGDVYACGMNSKGQNGTPYVGGQPRFLVKQVPIPASIVSVATGLSFTLFLEDFGNVWVSGEGCDGISTTVPRKIENFAEVEGIYCGDCHALFLKADGSVWVFGSNEFGQLGIAETSCQGSPIQVTMFPNAIVDISCGRSCTVLLDCQGIVWAGGRSGVWPGNRIMSPLDLPGLPIVKSVTCGNTHHYFLCEDASVWRQGRLNNTTDLKKIVFEKTKQLCIVQMSAGGNHCLFLDSDGSVWGFASNSHGQLGLGDKKTRILPAKIKLDKKILYVGCGDSHSFIVDEELRVWTFGSNEYGQLAITYEEIEPCSVVPQLVTQIDSIRYGQKSVQIKSARK